MISFDDAFARTVNAGRLLGSEQVPISQAHRRVLAEPVVARIQSPRWDVSVMDGYAVRNADLDSLPSTLPIVGDSFAGRPFAGKLPTARCVRIFTGAAVPAGADRVIVQEVVEREGELARFAQPLSTERFIRRAGSDFGLGEELLPAGTLMTPGAMVAVAAGDVGQVRVARRPAVWLLCTGDELAKPGTARASVASIPESVSFGVAALVEDWGGRVERVVRLTDDLAPMERAAGEALEAADLVVVTGGASVGEKDFAKAMFAPARLDLTYSKVAMKPGKPVWLGRARGKLVLGLPGNPTSALVTARLLLAPLLCALTGRDPAAAADWHRMPVGETLEPGGDRETFSRGYVACDVVRLVCHQDSGAQKALAQASLLVRRAAGAQAIGRGALAEVLYF